MTSDLIHLKDLVDSYRTTMQNLLSRPRASGENTTRAFNTLDNFEDHIRNHERSIYRVAMVKVLTASDLLNGTNDTTILNAIEDVIAEEFDHE